LQALIFLAPRGFGYFWLSPVTTPLLQVQVQYVRRRPSYAGQVDFPVSKALLLRAKKNLFP
jgi:hypothetical protein